MNAWAAEPHAGCSRLFPLPFRLRGTIFFKKAYRLLAAICCLPLPRRIHDATTRRIGPRHRVMPSGNSDHHRSRLMERDVLFLNSLLNLYVTPTESEPPK